MWAGHTRVTEHAAPVVANLSVINFPRLSLRLAGVMPKELEGLTVKYHSLSANHLAGKKSTLHFRTSSSEFVGGVLADIR